MGDHELFQLEDIDAKQTSRDLVLVWKQFDWLIDIEVAAEKK
jgi:hypothetical protein